MTRATTMLFLTLAVVLTLGCCSGGPCGSDGAPAAESSTQTPSAH